ncbi:hypothetical protein BT96DRAFT_959787 [Gymnopus androsaceus JB14]|uniref:Uncharacterized protein n=1 Tax=Gymnopus androsaceus JB14 TaxID=1447944 RepID=A0A6A4GZM4_9AGAR|nr:hypothetical protein BT96DRAFT_959787 [Gymnopus androsaceus JB14]
MYRNVSSPIFDAPEFPTLRRVKPLPKRRKTSVSVISPDDKGLGPGSPRMLVAESNGVPHSLHMPGLPPIPLSLPGPNATAEELLAHADALQSYYLPILDAAAANISAVADGFANAVAVEPDMLGNGMHNLSLRDRDRDDESDRGDGDGDYIDHLQQPGNTKKRKVPANISRLQGAAQDGEDETEESLDLHDGTLTMGIPTGIEETESQIPCRLPSASYLVAKQKSRLSAATLAGLQHKETLKVRKRQLAAVLGALSHGDTLALDQALSGTYPFPSSGIDATGAKQAPKIRLSKRTGPRMARRVKAALPFLRSDFTFVCHSATADRLSATKQEVATLRRRFENELARQASRAAAASRAVARASASPAKSSKKRGDRARTTTTGTKKLRDQPAEFLDPSRDTTMPMPVPVPSNTKTQGRGKKKKRSALANASNPHHLRNYVPSRLPYSDGANQANANAHANDLGPFPLRFLSAEIPPRRGKRSSSRTRAQAQAQQSLNNPADEWVCVFCEYELFFGDDGEYRKAVRRRKSVLKRRRRARERAAAAASGTKAKFPSSTSTQATAKKTRQEDEEEDGDDDVDYEPLLVRDNSVVLFKDEKADPSISNLSSFSTTNMSQTVLVVETAKTPHDSTADCKQESR